MALFKSLSPETLTRPTVFCIGGSKALVLNLGSSLQSPRFFLIPADHTPVQLIQNLWDETQYSLSSPDISKVQPTQRTTVFQVSGRKTTPACVTKSHQASFPRVTQVARDLGSITERGESSPREDCAGCPGVGI